MFWYWLDMQISISNWQINDETHNLFIFNSPLKLAWILTDNDGDWI